MQCPRCHRAVTVAAGSANRQVKCPHCEQPFKVPGAAQSASDEDDDWLNLDDSPPPSRSSSDAENATRRSSSPPRPQRVPGEQRSSTSAPQLSEKDRALLAQFEDDDFGDLSGGSEPAAPPSASAPREEPAASPNDPFFDDDLPPANPSPPPAAQPTEYLTEYRVKCPLCGSILYAKAAQAGKQIKCPDCHHDIKVPPPPKKPKKYTVDLDQVETYRFGGDDVRQRPSDPFRKSAQELLDAAEKEDVEEAEPDYDTPKIGEWAKSVFGIFLQPGVAVYWILLSLFAAVPAYVALKLEHPVLVMGLFPAGFFFATLVVACGFAILESVANQEESVTQWPVLLDPTEWIPPLFLALAALALPGIPAWILGQMLFGPDLAAVSVTMIAVYLLFPFVLLSMLDMQSVMMPFSPEVARSVTRCEESWGGFYFSSGVMFFSLFMVFVFSTMMSPPIGAIFAIFATVAVVFIYFAMLGRLAYSIGQSVNEPPMVNDIDRSRRSDNV